MKLRNKAAHPLVVVYRQHGAISTMVLAPGVTGELYESAPSPGREHEPWAQPLVLVGCMLVVPTLRGVDPLDEHQHLEVTR